MKQFDGPLPVTATTIEVAGEPITLELRRA